MVASTAFSAPPGWSVCPGIRWSISRGIGGQFAPESGGQYQRILQYIRKVLGLKPAPEFEQWLIKQGISDNLGNLLQINSSHKLLTGLLG